MPKGEKRTLPPILAEIRGRVGSAIVSCVIQNSIMPLARMER